MVSHEIAAKPTASAPSRISAIRQTPRSLRVSRSRSMGDEADPEETSARGVGNLVIRLAGRRSQFGRRFGRSTLPEDYGVNPTVGQRKGRGGIAKWIIG